MISLRFVPEQVAALREGLELAARARGFALSPDGVAVEVTACGDGLSVSGKDGVYSIGYSRRSEFFRAVALLVGHLEQGKTDLEIREKAQLELCGGMLDCSRNAVPRPETVIDQLARSALMGMNCVMLYTEDTYEVEGYPYFGYMRGRYSREELRRLDRAADALGIELIPCIQTLAHLKTALKWEFAKDLKDDPNVLLIGEESAYQLIEAMFASARQCFRSRRIHIGMDEAEGVGRGKYMDRNGCRDRFELLSEHLDRVCRIAGKYDFEPMMWSDMFFKFGSQKHIYYDPDARFPENISQMLPEKLSMVYWDYFGTDADRYRAMIDSHRRLGREVIFAGAVYKWQGMAPNHTMTFAVTHPALQACRDRGVKKVIATMWGDDGGEVSQYTVLLGMQLFAEYNFYETVSMEHLMERFRLCMGMDGQDQLKLAIDDIDRTDIYSMRAPLSKQILYQDVLQGLLDRHFMDYDLNGFYDARLAALETLKPCPLMEPVYDYYRTLTPILRKKWDLGIRIRRAYQAGDKEALKAYAGLCGELLALYEGFQQAAYRLWMWENKPFGFERFDLRLGGVMQRIRTAKLRLEDYCAGTLPRIEELEEEILYFSPQYAGKLPIEKRFRHITSVSAEMGV